MKRLNEIGSADHNSEEFFDDHGLTYDFVTCVRCCQDNHSWECTGICSGCIGYVARESMYHRVQVVLEEDMQV